MVEIRNVWVVSGVGGDGMRTSDIMAVCNNKRTAEAIQKDRKGYADITERKAAVHRWDREDAMMDQDKRRPTQVYLIEEFDDGPLECNVDFPKYQASLKEQALAKLTDEERDALKKLGLD